jgi:hypothetical protein
MGRREGWGIEGSACHACVCVAGDMAIGWGSPFLPI